MTGPTPPPLPDELELLLRRMDLPYMRRMAPEVLATARAQRWDPAEVLKVLLGEEVSGRERSGLHPKYSRCSWGRRFLDASARPWPPAVRGQHFQRARPSTPGIRISP